MCVYVMSCVCVCMMYIVVVCGVNIVGVCASVMCDVCGCTFVVCQGGLYSECEFIYVNVYYMHDVVLGVCVYV